MTVPRVSILMVARNSAPFIDASLRSARAQSVDEIEIVVVDDGSVDGTKAIASDHAKQDSRVRVLQGPCKGLGAVRNASLDAARGSLALVLDSDDLLHARHVETLLAEQAITEAQIVAGNMIEFRQDESGVNARLFATGERWTRARAIGTAEFVQSGMMGRAQVSLGYLKPLFDLRFLKQHGIRYDERLRIGEDFDLILRAMMAGAQYRFIPDPSYYYRKHDLSTSHRLARSDVEGLIVALDMLRSEKGPRIEEPVAAMLADRRRNLDGLLRHIDALDALKKGRIVQGLRSVGGDALACRMTLGSLFEALTKRVAPDRLRRAANAWSVDSTPADLAASLDGFACNVSASGGS